MLFTWVVTFLPSFESKGLLILCQGIIWIIYIYIYLLTYYNFTLNHSLCAITYAHILDNFNAGTPNHHHCLMSFNLGTILLGRKECDITYAHILDNFNFDFNFNSKCSLSVNFNIKVCLIIYANHHLFDELCRSPSA